MTLQTVKDSFYAYLEEAFNLTPQQRASITFSLNTDSAKKEFGDLNSNAAMIIAQLQKTNPGLVAQQIIDNVTHPCISKIVKAGPGFLNFYLTPEFFVSTAQDLFNHKKDFFKLNPAIKKQNFCIEFVSANPTGPLHVGHGRGGIIGDVLSNIQRFLGHGVVKEFYINDAGSQIQKLGTSLKIRCQQEIGLAIEIPEEGYHGQYLKELAQQFVNEFGRDAVQQPIEIFAQYGYQNLLKKIQKTLHDYGISFDVWFSEKTLHDNDHVAKAMELLKEKNFTYVNDNALWFKSMHFGDDKDRVLQRADKQYTYIAADVAYLQNKLQRGFSRIIMILGQDHHSYGVRMKAIMQALGNNADDLDIILYQLVAIKESGELVRMSKRAGTMVSLQDIIDTVGKDVARFFYLNRKAEAHLDFDLELATKKTEDNPVYYIQYAYVRIVSIMHKAQEYEELKNITHTDLKDLTSDESSLLKKILELKDLLASISIQYQTHLLAYYTIELAHAFHSYYSKNRVIEIAHPQQSRNRLALLCILKNSFELCFELLGISQVSSM